MGRFEITRNTLHDGKIWQSYMENFLALWSSENLFSDGWFLRCVWNKGRKEGSSILRGIFTARNIPLGVLQTHV